MKRNQAANVMTACVWAAAAMLLFPGPGSNQLRNRFSIFPGALTVS